jgi:hypothetical protein
MAYVPHGQLATWPINHVAKISSLKKFKKISIFEKKKKKKRGINMNILATWLATWFIGHVTKIHVANYQRKAFRYVVDCPHGKIAMWVITTSQNRHVATVPGTVDTWLKIKFFLYIYIYIQNHSVSWSYREMINVA